MTTTVMSEADAEEYTQALGQVVAGGWRQVALGKRLGVPAALGLSVNEWVEKRLGGYVRMSIPERREAVAELSEEGMSTREIGDVLGVGQATVVRDGRASDSDESPHRGEANEDGPSAEESDSSASPDLTPAEKDRARKERGAEKRESKRAEDESAPALTAELRHGSFADHVGELPAGSVSLLLTDPPYGAGYRSGFRWASQHRPITGDATSEDATAALGDALEALEPKMAWNAHLLVFCRWREEPEFRAVVAAAGWTLRGSLIWIKNEPGMGDLNHSFGPAHERILHATRGEARMRHRESDTLTCPRVVSGKHPTEKPVALLERLIKATTNPRDLVADPFAGVASTLIAAVNTGRRGWGCELESDYHAEGAALLAA